MKIRWFVVIILIANSAVFAVGQTPEAPKPAAAPRAQIMDRMPPPPPLPPTPPPGLPRIPMAWWKDSHVAKELNLNDQQLAKLEQTFTASRLQLIDLRANLEKEETKLEPLITADRVDENQVSSQLDAVVAARGRLEKANAMMSVNMRKVLTLEQWKKLQTMQMDLHRPGHLQRDDHMERHVGRGPGFPGKTPEPPDGPNGPDGKDRPTEDQPR